MQVDKKKIDKKVKNLMSTRESKIEKALITAVQSKKGACIKFTSPGKSGVPDRICLLPGGNIWFVETKKPGKKLEPLQKIIHTGFEKLGFKVRTVSNLEELKQFESEIQST